MYVTWKGFDIYNIYAHFLGFFLIQILHLKGFLTVQTHARTWRGRKRLAESPFCVVALSPCEQYSKSNQISRIFQHIFQHTHHAHEAWMIFYFAISSFSRPDAGVNQQITQQITKCFLGLYKDYVDLTMIMTATYLDCDSIRWQLMFVIWMKKTGWKKTGLLSGSSVPAFISKILPEFEKKSIKWPSENVFSI